MQDPFHHQQKGERHALLNMAFVGADEGSKPELMVTMVMMVMVMVMMMMMMMMIDVVDDDEYYYYYEKEHKETCLEFFSLPPFEAYECHR